MPWIGIRSAVSAGMLCVMGIGCSSLPPPRPVYQDQWTSIQLRVDAQAGGGHTHPALISPEQMAGILAGIRVQKLQDPVFRLVTGEKPVRPAFSAEEIRVIAPQLSRALALATPEEIATFYRRVSSANVGLAVTSGGVFVRDDRLYLVLANYRALPSDVMRQINPAYELDPLDAPLLALRAGDFKLSFSPPEAEVHLPGGNRGWNYPDPAKVLVVDLTLAQKRSDQSPRPPQP
ncbi:hypothetical protein [Nitrospira calida]|jgi:hypothetical protein